MIIHQPETIRRDGDAILWSRIEMARKRDNFPDYIWYRVPEAYSRYLSPQSDAFLVPALIAGMHFGEDIEVRGAVSPRLAYSLQEYQFLLHFHLSKYLRCVAIRYNQLQAWNTKPKGVAATFSGGVDSFFTIKAHLPESQPIPEYRITHALFIQNFDIVNRDIDKYQALFLRFQGVLREFGIELVPMETNLLNTILPWLSLDYFYGPVLAGCGMVMGGLFKRFYIPSSRDYYQLAIRESSSNPLADRLLSTDSLDIVHHGANVRRVEKIVSLSDWKPAQDHLRVCIYAEFAEQNLNCSRCEKCSRTMFPLYVLGKLDQFNTFSRPFRSKWDTLGWARKLDPSRDQYMPETFAFTREHRSNLLPWLYFATCLGGIRYWLVRLTPGFIWRWLRRNGHFIDTFRLVNALDNPAVIDLIHSVASSRQESKNDHPPA